MLPELTSPKEGLKCSQEILSNQHLNKALMDSLPYPSMLIGQDRRIIRANKIAKEMGVQAGTHLTLLHKLDSQKKLAKHYQNGN